MEKEIVIRDPQNKRIQKLLKIDISEEIKNECYKCLEKVLFEQSQEIYELFQLIDKKQTFGLISEISSCVLGIEEYLNMDEENKTRYLSQYYQSIYNLYSNLVNLSSQLIFAIKEFPDEVFDQVFIKNTIQALLYLKSKYIMTENNLFTSQEEVLLGQLFQLIRLYNSRIQNLIDKCQNDNSMKNKISNFINDFQQLLEVSNSEFSKIENMDPNNSGLLATLVSFAVSLKNTYVISKDLKQFEQHLRENEIQIQIKEELPYQEKDQIEFDISGW